MEKDRFINLEELRKLYKQRDELTQKINSYTAWHCKKCGDTKPKHNFDAMFSGSYGLGIIQTSMVTCNRCTLTDEQYLKTFKEPKEII